MPAHKSSHKYGRHLREAQDFTDPSTGKLLMRVTHLGSGAVGYRRYLRLTEALAEGAGKLRGSDRYYAPILRQFMRSSHYSNSRSPFVIIWADADAWVAASRALRPKDFPWPSSVYNTLIQTTVLEPRDNYFSDNGVAEGDRDG